MSTVASDDNIYTHPDFLARQEFADRSFLWPSVVTGFGAAVSVWISWYILHLPGMAVPPAATATALLAVLGLSIAIQARSLGPRSRVVGLGSGLVAALINLLLLGSKLTEAHEGQTGRLIPSAPVIASGFVLASLIIGGLCGWIGGSLGSSRLRSPSWLGRFGLIAIAALAPLIAIGGAVTSAGAGMAVPNWPGTYGSNMFLYPIGLMADPYIFLEHTHRLFGTLVGLTTLTLMIAVLRVHGGWRTLGLVLPVALAGVGVTLAYNAGRLDLTNQTLIGILTPLVLIAVGALAWSVWRLHPGGIAACIFGLVCLQGMLGALRVTEISSAYGVVHGVLAQMILAGSAVLAATLTPIWQMFQRPPLQTLRGSPKAIRFAGFAFAALLIQLVMAALFRHTGSSHALWTHVGFSIVVVVAVGGLGFALGQSERYSSVGRTMRTIGSLLVVDIGFQFVLGFVAWAMLGDTGGQSRVVMYDALEGAAPPDLGRTVIATIHQANGAFMLSLTAAGWAWAARSGRSGSGRD